MSEGSDTALKGGFPLDDAAVRLREEGDLQRAVTAYRFWYPTVSVEGIFNGNREIGLADNDEDRLLRDVPRQVGFTLNSDTPYAAGALDLSDGPMVIELPPGAYISLVDDHHQRWVMDMGIPGRPGQGGKHLVLGPDFDGDVPDGFYVGRSSSYKVLVALRAMPVGGDQDKALEALRAVRIYPLRRPALTRSRVEMVETPNATSIAPACVGRTISSSGRSCTGSSRPSRSSRSSARCTACCRHSGSVGRRVRARRPDDRDP